MYEGFFLSLYKKLLVGDSSEMNISSGVVHTVPTDLKSALIAAPKALAAWEDITPLARNEWICWTISVKRSETRAHHIKRAIKDLSKGKRRPCCWAGCSHR